ncbi:alpha-L-rhamnosidase [Robertmurraya korlensis]|uniref:alpha-L-rhamnosidase n=1 Tax=Robertmurraya korlensis TaxID=519977 RepID=UPI001E6350B7|nr:alpha-L-rhamnosidase [Robertmurraya korlensis]
MLLMDRDLWVENLTVESQKHPLGIDVVTPRLSWWIQTEQHHILQTAYHVIVTDDDGTEVWNTEKVKSDQSLWIDYQGTPLQSRKRYDWKVKVWDNQGRESDWSQLASWEMGLLKQEDWLASWIEPEQQEAVEEDFITIKEIFSGGLKAESLEERAKNLRPPQLLRRPFTAEKRVKKARVYVTSHGIYQLELNGRRVGDIEFAPDFTAYDVHLQYQTYDVTPYIHNGDNVLGVIVADGWYTGRIQLTGHSCQYGNKLGLLLQLEMEYEDGTIEIVTSDENFVSSPGPWQYADLFIGEKYDARLEQEAWSCSNFVASGWSEVNCVNYSFENLTAQYGPSVKAMEELLPCDIHMEEDGSQIIDFGQTIAGRIQMSINVPRGTTICMEHSEVLDQDGKFFMNIMGRNKDQIDVYIAKGNGMETYEPSFTYHGFRYVRVTGHPHNIRKTDVKAIVLYSDMETTGHFKCSDGRVNQLQHNIQWSQKTNMLSIPTDCPQREKAGWTGDLQVFAPTAAFNMDVDSFLTRWLVDVRLEQFPDGQIANFVPTGKYYEPESAANGGELSSAGWGDAIIIVPWVLYERYGDKRILEENFEAMTKWMSYVRQKAETGIPDHLEDRDPIRLERQKYLWNTGFHFGDWLIPSIKNPMESAIRTKELVATCFYANSTLLLAEISKVLGKPEMESMYKDLNSQIRKAFEEEYVDDKGRISSHFQGIYILALQMNMVSEQKRSLVVNQLVELIKENGYKLDTGFLSIPYLMDVLCEEGQADLAYRLLYQTECPSWLYEVEKGATTIWESWSAISPDGTVGHMSFNHYAFGCIGDWLYRHIAGIKHDQPGYKTSIIEPHTDCGLTFAKAKLKTGYGILSSSWLKKNHTVQLEIEVPANTTATVILPPNADITGDWDGLTYTGDGKVKFVVGSGIHQIEYAEKCVLNSK